MTSCIDAEVGGTFKISNKVERQAQSDAANDHWVKLIKEGPYVAD